MYWFLEANWQIQRQVCSLVTPLGSYLQSHKRSSIYLNGERLKSGQNCVSNISNLEYSLNNNGIINCVSLALIDQLMHILE